MTYIADLHLHSPYARATSKDLTFENMAAWAKLKGIDLLASADFTHPVWFRETASKLAESDGGLYEFDGVRFILGTEVACYGFMNGRSRRVHMLLFAPDLSTVERLNEALASKGTLAADGRPILHLLPGELVSLAMEANERCIVMPAHAWTPWFGVFGSKSGFDSLEEAFGSMAKHISAIETGLSSDPAMNWRVPELDSVAIVSFSDAHSLPNMGREVTAFAGTPTYDGLRQALHEQKIEYTVEFFPEEGKYHNSGHRNCGVSLNPEQVRATGERCPVCGRPMTLGVLERVEALSGSDCETWRDAAGLVRSELGRPPFYSMVGLQQIIAERLGIGVNTRGVRKEYLRIVQALGGEIHVLTSISLREIETVAGEKIAEGIDRARRGDIVIEPGFDGQYGRVRVWP